jgi:hypothetical protein
MKVMSIKVPHCFSKECGWIPVMQTIQLLGCPTLNMLQGHQTLIIVQSLSHVRCEVSPIPSVDGKARENKTNQEGRPNYADGRPEEEKMNLVKTKEWIIKHHNTFGGEKPNKNVDHVSTTH